MFEPSESPSIPIFEQPPSLWEGGPTANNLASMALARHPVDEMQRIRNQPGRFDDLTFVRHVYGPGLAMTLALEQKTALHEHASRGVHRSSPGLYGEIVTGRDSILDFSDFLSLPQHRPDLKKPKSHIVMERQLNM